MIPFSEPNLGLLEKQYINEALNSGWIGGKGDFIDRFESKFAKYIGVKYAITCSSGTMALLLAYHATGMSKDSIFICPDNTFIAPVNMAAFFTVNIHLQSVDEATWTLKLKDLKASHVTAVHLYGNPCDMGDNYKGKFILIEDCAESLGSKFKGKMVGSFGLASCFSFHSAKMITTGEGGMVCTNEKVIAERVNLLKNHSMTQPYKHLGMGYNGRMTNVQAAMGLAQLERINELSDKKRDITKFYNENLDKQFIRQVDQRKSDVVHWANAYRLPSEEMRTKLLQSFIETKIETRPGFLSDEIIVLPCSTKLSENDLEYIVRTANEAIA